jgi:hypothetical protein
MANISHFNQKKREIFLDPSFSDTQKHIGLARFIVITLPVSSFIILFLFSTRKMIRLVYDDILNAPETYYIAHQCNTTSTASAGIASAIFAAYPEANTYSGARKPGTVDVIGRIVNLYSQVYPGSARGTPIDTAEERLIMFRECLKALVPLVCKKNSTERRDTYIAMPYKIGCGLAGGNWPCYLEVLSTFVRFYTRIVIVLYSLEKPKLALREFCAEHNMGSPVYDYLATHASVSIGITEVYSVQNLSVCQEIAENTAAEAMLVLLNTRNSRKRSAEEPPSETKE